MNDHWRQFLSYSIAFILRLLWFDFGMYVFNGCVNIQNQETHYHERDLIGICIDLRNFCVISSWSNNMLKEKHFIYPTMLQSNEYINISCFTFSIDASSFDLVCSFEDLLNIYMYTYKSQITIGQCWHFLNTTYNKLSKDCNSPYNSPHDKIRKIRVMDFYAKVSTRV